MLRCWFLDCLWHTRNPSLNSSAWYLLHVSSRETSHTFMTPRKCDSAVSLTTFNQASKLITFKKAQFNTCFFRIYHSNLPTLMLYLNVHCVQQVLYAWNILGAVSPNEDNICSILAPVQLTILKTNRLRVHIASIITFSMHCIVALTRIRDQVTGVNTLVTARYIRCS